jgi:hypothetical protein
VVSDERQFELITSANAFLSKIAARPKDCPWRNQELYRINQDYSFGESVRSQAKAMLAAKWAAIRVATADE